MALPTIIPRTALAQGDRAGANDRIGVAGIGVGRQGSGIFRSAAGHSLTQVVCVCDVNLPRAEGVARACGAKDVYQDYRRVLDRKDVDAITTATPEHWRANICISAALAGKNVYAEKPMTLTIPEGRLMVKAARRTGIAFQVGSQQRSQREAVTLDRIEAGEYRAGIDRRYALDESVEADRHVDREQKVGNVVIEVASDQR